MGCCGHKKLTRAQKAAQRFGEYQTCLVGGLLASLVVLGLSAFVIAKVPRNAAMIWHLCLSILTAAIMIILLARTSKFAPVAGCPTATKAGWTYATVLFVAALWVTAIVSLFLDWPSDSEGRQYNKRYDWAGGIQNGGIEGPVWGCFAVDASFS
ncbi:hypothetical protein C8A00DRAFT_35016, partial [Chaetomidium leptoderma]